MDQNQDAETVVNKKKPWQFWLTLISLCAITFLCSFDVSTIAVALPRITSELNAADKYIWIANSFVLSQTVIQPPLAQLCNIFGRQTPMILAIVLFTIGAGVAGGAQSAAGLIAGRTIQGLGSGAILVLVEVIVCDLVPLRERGTYTGIILSFTAIGTLAGPVVAGALADSNWRWIFYLNIPFAGAVLGVLIFCLRLHYSKSPWRTALTRIDWVGNFLFIGSVCSVLLGLIVGGTQYPWSSYHVVVPIVLGTIGYICFHIWEYYCKEPSVPAHLFQNRTSVAGFYMVFISSMLVQWVSFVWPIYFQGVRKTTPLKAGINTLPYLAFLVPSASIAGVLLSKFGRYRPLHAIGFCLALIGPGLNTLLTSTTPTGVWVLFQMVDAIGRAFLFPTVLPSILTALPEADVATATGMYSFLRSFGFVWGFTVPGIILNTIFDVSSISDAAVRENFAHGRAYQAATGAYIKSLPPKVQGEVVHAYLEALRPIWIAVIAFGATGLLAVAVEKHIPLRVELQTEFGLKTEKDKSETKKELHA
ncbi:hypothetical protein N0V90_000519 [Kalmusia sp. IMI 367209]|nr:hypothetical protein N0V90_000519 [Kalmusia sp. IMI 367209]